MAKKKHIAPKGLDQMPRYRSHKEVRALKIEAIYVEVNDATGGPGALKCAGWDELIPVSAEYMEKHDPSPGGYVVFYEDGYQSWSPAEAFESGYTRSSDASE